MEARSLRASLLVACASVVGAGAFLGLRSDPAPSPPPVTVAPTTTTTTTTTVATTTTIPPPKPSAVVADAIGATVGLYTEPGVVFEDRPTMDNPTHEGLPVVFLVLEERGDWLRVQVSMRPNGLQRWVKRSEVNIRTVPNRVEVRVAERQLLVYDGEGELLLQETVGVGSDRTPTPLGRFFVDGWVSLNGLGPYGAGQLSVAGFSDVLHSFGGGVGQIAIHGTNRPQSIGESVSNGCVRMHNDALDRLVRIAPLGTPVDIVA